jgi:diketogulonate reductase-like aldo/keto reductase
MPMIFKKLGNTQISIPAIGQGTTGIGSYQNFNPENVKTRIEVLKYGVDLGMTYLDTADLYGGGFSEETLGKVIKGIREKVFIASKFNPRADVKGSIKNSIEGSLKRLGTDYIDLYQVHWPNPLLPIPEIMGALSLLVGQGKIRNIGVSNYSLEEFKEAQAGLPGHTIVSNQVEYNLFDRSVEKDFLPYCETTGVTLIAYNAFNQGVFLPGEKQKAVLNDISVRYRKTIPQLILRWLISHKPVIAITKSGSMLHTRENALSADFNLEERDVLAINGVYGQSNTEVPTDRIRLSISDQPVYKTMKEALANDLDLIPSPLVLSKIIQKRNHMKPIRLVLTKDISGKYDYDIDNYDTWDNVKKYWAWIIAYGQEVNIPAFIPG